MIARRARPDEYLAFTRLSPDPKGFRRELARLVDLGYTAPRLWFVAGQEGAPDAAAVYWTLPSLPEQLMLLDLYASFADSAAPARLAALLSESISILKEKGAESVEARLFSDSSEHIYEKIALLRAAGLPLLQEKESFSLDSPPPLPPASAGLRLVPLRDCGLPAFRAALARINARTLDRYDLESSGRSGNAGHAEEMFIALSDIDRDEGLWSLAEDAEGLAGCVVPQRLDAHTGAVNYFGVVPARRRRGYGAALFSLGASALFAAGARKVVCDLDLANHPFLRILERAGARRAFRTWVFKAELSALPLPPATP